MTPWKPEKVLMVGDHVAGLRDLVAERRPDLTLRAKPLAAIDAADLGWADVYVGFRKPAVDGWGSVRWIHSIGAGVDGLVFVKALPDGIILTKSGEDFGPAIGEWCLTRALAVNQHLTELAEDQAHRRWGRHRGVHDPVMLRGQRVTIMGTGQVGSGIARAFRALGCSVVGLSRSGRAGPDFDQAYRATTDFAVAVRAADWLILAAPLTADTLHFLDRDRLSLCGGLYLMNVGRGALVEEGALIDALDEGWIGGAALDVFEKEPLPTDSPLWAHPKVTISPHISGPSTLEATARGFLESLEEVSRGDRPRLAVDPHQGY